MKTRNNVLRAVCLMLVMGLLLTGCSTSPTVMKVDGAGVTQGEYAYYYGYLGATYAMYGLEAEQSALEEYTQNQLKEMQAVKKLAAEYGLKLTAEENKAFLDSKTAEIESMGGRTAYTNLLKGLGLSESKYNELGRNAVLYQKIAAYLYGTDGTERPADDALRADYVKNYVHVTHILIDTRSAETDADREALKKKAEAALTRAKAGEDFVALVTEYGEDPGVKETPDVGYYFTAGEMDAAFEAASFALAEGEISEIVDSTYGHHIIKRLPIEDEYVDTVMTDGEYYNTYVTKLLGEKLTAITEPMNIEKTSAFDKMDLTTATAAWTTLFTAASAASSTSGS